MKKKILVLGMTLVMAAGALTGCKKLAPKEDYQADIKHLSQLKEINVEADTTTIVTEIGEIAENMEAATEEGQAVKESLKEYVEYTEGIDLTEFATMEEKEVEKMQDQVDAICEELAENMDELKENADRAGVSAEELGTVENIGMLGL